jgi:4-amino-4-deoxy-L-arabinose transferase-like glycosyltransferase
MSHPSEPTVPASLFGRSRLLQGVALALLFLAGLGIRLYDLRDLPLDFHPTRQLFTAIIARSYYYRDTPSTPTWERERAAAQLAAEETEPPSIDWLAAQTYRLIGHVDLFYPRLYSALFWLLAGLPLFWIARELSNTDGGLLALGVYLLAPYGVIASRSFQPDPLMTGLTIAAWWCMLRWLRAREAASSQTVGLGTHPQPTCPFGHPKRVP